MYQVGLLKLMFFSSMQSLYITDIWNQRQVSSSIVFHRNVIEDSVLLEYDAVLLANLFPIFWRNTALCTFKTMGTNYPVTWHHIIISQRNSSQIQVMNGHTYCHQPKSVFSYKSDESSKYTPWNKAWSSCNRGWNTTASIWIWSLRNPFLHIL